MIWEGWDTLFRKSKHVLHENQSKKQKPHKSERVFPKLMLKISVRLDRRISKIA